MGRKLSCRILRCNRPRPVFPQLVTQKCAKSLKQTDCWFLSLFLRAGIRMDQDDYTAQAH
jgi:hypothetical protein